MDDTFFNCFIKDNPEGMEYVLNIIMDRDDLHVKSIDHAKMHSKLLAKQMKYLKSTKTEVNSMCKIMEDYDNKRYDQDGIQRGEQCVNDMFTDYEPFDKIVRYSGLTPKRVHKISIADGFIKE